MTRAEKRKANRERWRRFCRKRAAAAGEAREERRAGNRAAFAERAEERLERDRELGLVHTCARCGRPIRVQGLWHGGWVRLGGKAVCASCAKRRFARRIDLNAQMDPRTIQ